MTRGRDFLITGIPRSGTTLLTSTLAQVPNFVALSEPPQLSQFRRAKLEPGAYIENLADLLDKLRGDILAGRPVPNRFERGSATLASNYFRRSAAGSSKTYEVREEVHGVLGDSFSLFVKNNAQFTALLPYLSARYPVIATLRDPIACLLSWRSLDLSISHGRQPGGERFSAELQRIGRLPDLLQRQVRILDWYFGQYWLHREQIQVLKYEDFVARPEVLRGLVPLPEAHRLPALTSMNRRPEYNHAEADGLRELIRRETEYVRHFYPDI